MLKSLISAVFVLGCVVNAGAQQLYSVYSPADYVTLYNRTHRHAAQERKQKHLKTSLITVEYFDRKGKLKRGVKSDEVYFNSDGFPVEEKRFNKKGRLTRRIEFEYDSKGYLVKLTHYNSQSKIIYQNSYKYTADSIPVEIINIHKGRSDKAYHYSYKYNDKWQLVENSLHTEAGKKLMNRFIYHYNKEGKKTKTELYNKKNKLIQVWNYDCGIFASVQEKTKDTSSVCVKEEKTEEGLIRTIEETKDEKGRIVRIVRERKEDFSVQRYYRYNSSNRLTTFYETTLHDSDSYTLAVKHYNRWGGLSWNGKTTYFSKNKTRLRSEQFHDEKLVSREIFTYQYY